MRDVPVEPKADALGSDEQLATVPRHKRHSSIAPLSARALCEELKSLDNLIHARARLMIVSALHAYAGEAAYSSLLEATGLTHGNLTSHLAKLEAGGLLQTGKRFVGRKPRTKVTLTARGAQEMERYWQTMGRLTKEHERTLPGCKNVQTRSSLIRMDKLRCSEDTEIVASSQSLIERRSRR